MLYWPPNKNPGYQGLGEPTWLATLCTCCHRSLLGRFNVYLSTHLDICTWLLLNFALCTFVHLQKLICILAQQTTTMNDYTAFLWVFLVNHNPEGGLSDPKKSPFMAQHDTHWEALIYTPWLSQSSLSQSLYPETFIFYTLPGLIWRSQWATSFRTGF